MADVESPSMRKGTAKLISIGEDIRRFIDGTGGRSSEVMAKERTQSEGVAD
jgi:hypothetical protein